MKNFCIEVENTWVRELYEILEDISLSNKNQLLITEFFHQLYIAKRFMCSFECSYSVNIRLYDALH